MDKQTLVENIVAVYKSAVAAGFASEANWYPETSGWLADVATAYGFPKWLVAYVTSALSPLLRWSVNKARTVEFLETENRKETTVGLKANWLKAAEVVERWMADNAFSYEDAMSEKATKLGNKTRSFFQNMMGSVNHVTIDTHAYFIATMGDTEKRPPLTNKTGVRLTDKQYDIFADAYRQAAKILNHKPFQVQAVTWVFWRTKDIEKVTE